jgi:hypothetical protein
VRYTKQVHEKILPLLKRDLLSCEGNGSFEKGIESCFVTAGDYWADIRAVMIDYDFESIMEEIWFFKNVKPLFTQELEYYSLLYHSILFCPPGVDRQRKFWMRECRRLDDFKAQNNDFFSYYISGSVEYDEACYTRVKPEDVPPEDIDAYDKEPRTRSRFDHLLAKLLALERYAHYSVGKLVRVGRKM